MAQVFDDTKPKHKAKGFKMLRVQLPSGLFKGYIYRFGNLIAFTEVPDTLEVLGSWTDSYINTTLKKEARK